MIARWLAASLFFLLLVVAWYLAVEAHIWSPLLLPSPLSVFGYLRSAAEDGTLLEATRVTVQRLLIGYGMGILAGLPLGLLTASSRWCQDTIGVLALGLQTLPSVCWVPLALLWFGQTEASLLFVVVMGTLWSLIIATDNGVRTIPTDLYARSPEHGFDRTAHLDTRRLAGGTSISVERHETGVGLCLALPHGG